MVLGLMWTSWMAPGMWLEQGNQPIQFARGFPSAGTESLMPQGISKSWENWSSLPRTVLSLKLKGPCPENYFSGEQIKAIRGGAELDEICCEGFTTARAGETWGKLVQGIDIWAVSSMFASSPAL